MSEGHNNEQVNMDAILDAALDELDDDDENKNEELPAKKPPVDQHSTPAPRQPPNNDTTAASDLVEDEMDQLNIMMKDILQGTNGTDVDEAFGEVMAKLQQQMAAEMQDAQKEENADKKRAPKQEEGTKKKKPPLPARPVFGPEPPPPVSEVDRTISKLLNDMASATTDEETPDDMDDMMKQFEKLGGEDMVDGMMQQLLAKDLMYEPMKEVTLKFPKWLEDNKESLSEEDYNNRCNQYQGLQRLISAYETEPDNADKIFELMKEVQEFGLPPSDIVADIAPDLALDEDGVPNLKSMQDCCVM